MSWKVHKNTTRSPLRRHRPVPTRSRRCRLPTDDCRSAERSLRWRFTTCGSVFLGGCSSGFFILEGFDFGVGMLMEPIARMGSGDREPRRRAVLNTIGPVWDGNEVWLLTAGGAMFAAFPGMYATVFSSLYLPLLAILFGMIVRAVSIEWRGKIDDPKWRGWADFGIAAGSWLPAVLWGVAFAILVRGLPVDAEHQVNLSVTDVLSAYTLLGGLATCGLFLLYGAIFVVLKTSGPVRDDALRVAVWLSLPVTALVAGFGIWTQLAHGKAWTWLALGVAVVAQLATVALIFTRRQSKVGVPMHPVVVTAVVVLLFGAMYPYLVPSTLDPRWSLTVSNASSNPYTLKVMTWAAALFAPLVVAYQGWTYWVFRQRISADRIPPSIGLARRIRLSPVEGSAGPAFRPDVHGTATFLGCDGRVRGRDLRLRNRVRDPAGTHCFSRHHRPCGTHARAVDADAGDSAVGVGRPRRRALASNTPGPTRRQRGHRRPQHSGSGGGHGPATQSGGGTARRRGRGRDSRTRRAAPIFHRLPAGLAARGDSHSDQRAVVLGLYDLRSALIVVITLPLIPLFMVLIGLATTERSAAALAAMTTLQARLLDLIAGIPTLRALGRAAGPEHRIAELGAAHRRSAMATLRIAFLSALVLELLATLGVALVAVSIGLRLVFGEMSLATGLTVLLLAPDVYWPLRRIGVEFHAAQDGRTAADKAFALIGEPSTPTARERTAPAPVARGARIRVEKLSVAGRDGLSPHDLDAVIEPGRVTVLTGRNGAGKTTSLQVIAGLTAPTTGRVTVAGIDIAELALADWWRQLSWLPQRPVLIPGTVGDNLALLGELDDVESACATAGFDAVLAELPDGMETVLGRAGVGLSLGQRQRLGLARALGSAAPVLLLDEPTAHLDSHTEDRVLRAIVERARSGATVVLVGHRERVVAIGDSVVEVVPQGLDEGLRYAPV